MVTFSSLRLIRPPCVVNFSNVPDVHASLTSEEERGNSVKGVVLRPMVLREQGRRRVKRSRGVEVDGAVVDARRLRQLKKRLQAKQLREERLEAYRQEKEARDTHSHDSGRQPSSEDEGDDGDSGSGDGIADAGGRASSAYRSSAPGRDTPTNLDDSETQNNAGEDDEDESLSSGVTSENDDSSGEGSVHGDGDGAGWSGNAPTTILDMADEDEESLDMMSYRGRNGEPDRVLLVSDALELSIDSEKEGSDGSKEAGRLRIKQATSEAERVPYGENSMHCWADDGDISADSVAPVVLSASVAGTKHAMRRPSGMRYVVGVLNRKKR